MWELPVSETRTHRVDKILLSSRLDPSAGVEVVDPGGEKRAERRNMVRGILHKLRGKEAP